MDYLEKPKISLELPKPKKKKNIFGQPIVLVILISFLVGAISGVASSLIVNGVIGNLDFGGVKEVIVQQSDESGEKPIEMPKIVEKEKIIYEEDIVSEMVKRASPAVISIMATEEVIQYTIKDQPLEPFFDIPGLKFEIPQYEQLPEKQKQTVARGTGFIISSDGMILTNKHVISDPKIEYSIVTSDGKTLIAKILATDPFNDIAILKVEAEKLPYLALGDSEKIKIGQTVVAIGFALGEYKNTVTKGVVSGIDRKVTASGGGQTEQLEDVIQTDAAINPGNSGGPLLNLKGEVIGINTAISNQGQLIGFAIPVNVAKISVESVKKFGKIIRPFLGVRYVIISDVLAKEEKLPVDYGAWLIKGENQTEVAVTPGSAADKAGLQENDIILEVDGRKIDVDNSLVGIIQKHQPGDEIMMKVLSKGEEKTVKIILGEYQE